jgi:hypothetical protein
MRKRDREVVEEDRWGGGALVEVEKGKEWMRKRDGGKGTEERGKEWMRKRDGGML